MQSVETFATLTIDAPAKTPSTTISAHAASDENVDWSKAFAKNIIDASSTLAIDKGEAFRLIPMSQLLAQLSLTTNDDGEIDESTLLYMQHKLLRQGLRLANRINGPLRMRPTDTAALYSAQLPEVSTRSTLTIGLYLLVWLAQADKLTDHDFAVIDRYISEHEPKGADTTAAKATARWLASRKLVFTRKRKIRAARLARFALRQELIIRSLLQMVSDATHTSDKRMQRLSTIYQALGLDAGNIHADIHRLATTTPQKSRKSTANQQPSAFDPSRLSDIKQSTLKAQSLLAEVFADTDNAEQPASSSTPNTPTPAQPSALTSLLLRLAQKSDWHSNEFAQLCSKFGLTPGAALESLNDMAYDMVDDAVATAGDDNSVSIDQDIAQQLIDCL